MPDSLYDATTIWELVERRAALSPDSPMLVDASDGRLSFGELARRAEQMAAALFSLGVRESTPVTWQLPSSIDTVVLAVALARLGALQNPILHIYRSREVAVALKGMGSELFVIPGAWRGVDYGEIAQSAIEGLGSPPRVVTLEEIGLGDAGLLPPFGSLAATASDAGSGTGTGTGAESGTAGASTGGGGGGHESGGNGREPRSQSDDGPADDPVRWIYYTSGTTSEPKGVRHSDGTLLAGGKGLALALGLEPDDVGSIAFPFAHIAGPDYLVTMLLSGISAVILDTFVPAEAVEIFRRHKVTLAGGSTAFYQALLNEQRKSPGEPIIPSLRLLAGGGAAKPAEVFHAARGELGVPIAHGYGMTEVPMITQGSPTDSDEQLIETEGAPVSGAHLRIVRADGTEAATGESGEVRVAGPMVAKGYTDPAADAEAFDDSGYFRTGDLGYLRADGHLTLTGRLKDVIIRKGENISAREIEELLIGHPKVGDVAVVGLPDSERGERVCAVVERVPGEQDLTFEEMTSRLRDAGLMIQKIPEQLEVVDSFPRNEALRKTLKYKLRSDLAARPWPS